MLVSRSRDKLINAIVFFATNTNYCGKVKLFKLLYLLDFTHFREAGQSVTEMDYLAWKLGPVPLQIEQEWEQLEPDLAAAVDIVPEQVFDHIRQRVVPKRPFDAALFTKRELRLMTELAARFRDDMTAPLIHLTHIERGPWDTIWDQGHGNNQRIPYALALPQDSAERAAILEAAAVHEGIKAADRYRH